MTAWSVNAPVVTIRNETLVPGPANLVGTRLPCGGGSQCSVLTPFWPQKNLKAVSKDLWTQLYEFSNEVNPDLSNYDADSGSCF